MRHKRIAYTFLLAGILSNPIFAKTSEETTEELITLEEFTITASKMDETLKELPQRISLMSKLMLKERNIDDIKKVIQQVPNMYTVEGIASTESNVRGLNISMHSLTNPVVIYMDGIPITNRYGYNVPMTNVEHIEVLSGPQGTLYGKDAIGGVINIITKQPGNIWEGSLGTEIGSYDKSSINCSVNGPIVPNLLYVGVWGSINKDNGWIDNNNAALDDVANDDEQKCIGVNLYLTPSEDFSIRLNVMHNERTEGFSNGGMIGVGDYDYETGWFAPASVSAFNNTKRSDFENADYDVDSYEDTIVDAQGLRMEYKTSLGTFESITAHHMADVEGIWDVDYGYADPTENPFHSFVFNGQAYYDISTHETISEELRWNLKLDSGIRWVTGLYFEKQDVDFENFSLQMFSTDYRYVSQNDTKSEAVFGQLVLPFLESFELTLGGRCQWVKKEINLDYYESPISNGSFTLGTPVAELIASQNWSTFLPKVAVNHTINKDWTAYISISEGYLPGGFNFFASTSDVDENRFDPQKSWSYEIGTKSSLFNDHLFLSTDVFYMDITDIHVFSIENNVSVTSNAAEASSYGLELEADFQINERWKTNMALGLIMAEYDVYTDNNGNINNGNKIQRTPVHSANIGLQYTDPSGFYGRVDLFHYGTVYFDASNQLKQDPYTLVNIKVGYYVTNNWEIYAYCNNATDTDYKTFGQTGAPAGILVEFGDPLEFGLGINFRF